MNKNIFLSCFIISLFFISCNAERRFFINARITGIPDGTKLMLQNLGMGGIYIDSTVVKNNTFNFQGHLTETPGELRIITSVEEIKKGQFYYTDLLIKNEKVTIEGDISDMPNNIRSKGSIVQREAEDYHKQIHNWNLKTDSLRQILNPEAVTNEKRSVTKSRIKLIQDSISRWDIQYIKEHFNSYIALLTYSYRRDFSTQTLDSLYSTLSDELKKSKYGKAIHTEINFPKPKTGDNFYDFYLADYKNKKLKLSEIKDKFILLQFAGSGCYGSNQSIQHMKEIYNLYSDKVVFVSSFFEAEEDYKNYVQQHGINWITNLSHDGKFSEANIKYGVTGTPTFYLLSPEKKIVASWFGYEDGIIENYIDKALGK